MMVVLTICLASCGGNSKSNESFDVTVDNTTISGKLSQCFSLVDKTYKYLYQNDKDYDQVTVELKCIKPLPDSLKAFIGVEVLDEDGIVISAAEANEGSSSDYKILQQATPGQVVTITIYNYNNETIEEKTPVKIRLSSIVEEEEEEVYTSSGSSEGSSDSSVSSDDSSDSSVSSNGSSDSSVSSDDSDDDNESISSSSKGSADWDSLLDSYEQYVDKYIALTKKAAKGDMSAMAEYAEFMEKAQELSNKMDGAKSNMSASQWARYTKITTKMAKAAHNLY